MIAAGILAFLRKFWPELLIAALLAAFAVVAYSHGKHVADVQWQSKYDKAMRDQAEAQARVVAQAAADAKANAEAGFAVEREALQRQQDTQDHYKTITNTVTRYVQSKPDLASCGLDARGLCYWNAANAGSDPAACDGAPHPNPVVPKPAQR